MNASMQVSREEILAYVQENDVKFIRLTFCDLFGLQKNISILPDELERVLSDGMSFDASAITGFCRVDDSDLFLKPEALSVTLLPWRPQQGRVARFYCSIFRPDGTPYEHDTREILRRAVSHCEAMNFDAKIGAECEFYLFKTDENGDPTREPFDNGSYFDIAPLDKGENVRREICLTLENMGLRPESSHHEQGPGQNEIDFTFADSLTAADELLSFKAAVKAIAGRNGLFASFLPKPLPGKSGNGLHINVSLFRNGQNVFDPDYSDPSLHESFMAGVLSKAREISLFLNPLENSYKRLGEMEAPGYVSWSRSNRSQLIRIPAAKGDRSRMELRSPDPAINPYLAYALILEAGLYGIRNQLKLPDESNENLYSAGADVLKNIQPLPTSLEEAVIVAEKSNFLRDVLGSDFLDNYLLLVKNQEEARRHAAQGSSDDRWFLYV